MNLYKLVSFLLLVSLAVSADTKVIYGEDNRQDVFEVTDSMLVELSKSTAAMIPNTKIISVNSYEVSLKGKTLEQRGMCSTERFASQSTVANCSGFLVGKDKLVTAGHCIRDVRGCESNAWVFDYKVDYSTQSSVTVSKSSVYKCKRIIKRDLTSSNSNDYALIELDRPVEDRDFLKVRKSGAPKVGDKLVVIGHPTGLPTKITTDATIRSINDIYFVADLDTYGGNSGSAVFNADTGVVEGILVRGEKDYVRDYQNNCMRSNVIGQNSGRGEDVTLITNIAQLRSYPDPASGGGSGPAPEEPGETPEDDDDEEESWWERFLRRIGWPT